MKLKRLLSVDTGSAAQPLLSHSGVHSVAAAILVVVGTIATAVRADEVATAGVIVDGPIAPIEVAFQGHPAFRGGIASPGGPRGVEPQPIEPQPPLVSGPFINFESPQFKPLALSSDSARLFATNTPNNTLLVLDVTGNPIQVLDEIPVGLDPVSVAVQPGTNDGIVWVANHISDNLSVVDIVAGTVSAVIEVGDEPINIMFDPTGAFAFIITHGSPPPDDGQPLIQEGAVVAVDAGSLAVVSKLFLDSNTPRAAVFNAALDQLVVASLHSGNNTMVVGHPINFEFDFPPPTNPPPLVQPPEGGTLNNACVGACACNCITFPLLWAVQNFSATSEIFKNSAELGPEWPDLYEGPFEIPDPPFVERIVFSDGGGWGQVVDVVSDGAGSPDPAMVALMNTEFGIANAAEVIQEIIDSGIHGLDHDLTVVDVSDPAGLGLSKVNQLGGVGTQLTGMAMNAIGEIFVANLEPLNTVRTEPALRGHFVDHEVVLVINPQIPGAFIHATDLHAGIPNFNDVTTVNPLAQQLSLANPMDIVFDTTGATAYVAAFGVDRVGALDGVTASVLGRVDVGRGPRALALDDAGDKLYVMNRTDLSISQIDVSAPANMQVSQTFKLFNPEPAEIKDGREFLYSTKFTNNYASSCALCHIDGGLDHVNWDLGDPHGDLQPGPPNLPGLENHPLKGPMVTLSLRGLDRHTPLHWRGDKPTFQDFNGAFDGLLGGSQIPSDDMDAYAAFADTMNYAPNPYRNRNDTFKDANAIDGLAQFIGPSGVPQNAGHCHICHEIDHGGAKFGEDGDEGINISGGLIFGQLQITTQLRGINRKFRSDLYNGFGLLHDGREDREDDDHPLHTFFATFFPNFSPDLQEDVIAYCEAFPTNVKPVVGWQVKPSTPVAPAEEADINMMITQHSFTPSRCDVIAKGAVGGRRPGFVLIATEPGIVFQSDMHTALTLADLLAFVNAGDSLVFTAVPPGSGKRIGIDQDLDGIGDGLDPMPQLSNDGDVDLNGLVNGEDIDDFIRVLFDPPSATIPEFHAADTNNDEAVDIEDVDSFVALLLSGGVQ